MSFEDPQWKRGLAQCWHTPGVYVLDSWGPRESCSSFNSLTQITFLLELFHHRLPFSSPRPPCPRIGSPHALGSLFSITSFPFDSLLFCLHKPRAGQQILGLIRSSREISPLLAALLISMHGSLQGKEQPRSPTVMEGRCAASSTGLKFHHSLSN